MSQPDVSTPYTPQYGATALTDANAANTANNLAPANNSNYQWLTNNANRSFNGYTNGSPQLYQSGQFGDQSYQNANSAFNNQGYQQYSGGNAMSQLQNIANSVAGGNNPSNAAIGQAGMNTLGNANTLSGLAQQTSQYAPQVAGLAGNTAGYAGQAAGYANNLTGYGDKTAALAGQAQSLAQPQIDMAKQLSQLGGQYTPYISQILQQGFDPQQQVYNQNRQLNTDSTLANLSAMGLGTSAYGAQSAAESDQKFNTNWQSTQLGRENQAITGATALGSEDQSLQTAAGGLYNNALSDYQGAGGLYGAAGGLYSQAGGALNNAANINNTAGGLYGQAGSLNNTAASIYGAAGQQAQQGSSLLQSIPAQQIAALQAYQGGQGSQASTLGQYQQQQQTAGNAAQQFNQTPTNFFQQAMAAQQNNYQQQMQNYLQYLSGATSAASAGNSATLGAEQLGTQQSQNTQALLGGALAFL